jgi:hypothetical protein
MNYSDLEERGIQRMIGIQAGIDRNNFELPANRNPARRSNIDSYIKSGELESPAMVKAMTAVASAESRIRRAKLSNLAGRERLTFEKDIFRTLIRNVEISKLAEIKTTMDSLFKMRNEEKPSNTTTAELLKLERLKLEHKYTAEDTALALMSHFEKYGYDGDELLCLSGISEKCHRRAEQVREQLPAELASPEAINLIKKLTELVELHSGQIGYVLKSMPTVVQKLHVGDLISSKIEPTISDLAIPEQVAVE